MRRFALLMCVPVLAAATFAASARPQPAATAVNAVATETAAIAATPGVATAEDAPLVVHEWGTFTNFSGSDGVQLEFRPLAQNDLPDFCLSWFEQLGDNFSKRYLWAFQRMETPVTYFYTPVERDVQVRVEFPQGLLTEFYPPVQAMTPTDLNQYSPGTVPADPNANALVEAIPLENSSLDWGTVHLIPIDSLATHVQDQNLARSMGQFLADRLVPDASDPHYAHARAVDAALVNIQVPENRSFYSKGDYFERFLFYRGVGNFTLPLALEAHGEGAYQLTNGGPDDIRSLFLVSVRNGEIRFNTYDRIAADGTLKMTENDAVAAVDDLSLAVSQALVAEGLYQKEADAMVNSWRDSWFAEEGTRLLYMVPQRITDELLPLHITPQPDEIVRVLVGRMEIMSPEDERRTLEIVQRSAKARALENTETPDGSAPAGPGDRLAAFEELLALGRLAEPALVRVNSISRDPVLKNEAATLIAELRTHYEQQVAVH
jgi:hypothetical protein